MTTTTEAHAEDWTPCQDAPEAWVGDNDKLRAQAARECARCPLDKFAACQKLAKVDPFGVMAGRDYGTTLKSAARIAAIRDKQLLPEDVKECETCGTTITRGRRGRTDWEKLRFCGRACYGSTLRVQGLPVVKVCGWCGLEFGRAGRSPSHWLAIRFCGVACSGAASSARRKEAS